jgi:predicted O-methyltransferase YrrM
MKIEIDNKKYEIFIKEVKDFLFLLRYFKIKLIYNYIVYKINFFFCYTKKTNYIFTNKNYKFSNNWFDYNLNDLFFLFNKYDTDKRVNILEIGSFEGKSAIFFLTFFKESKIYCVDTWLGSNELNNHNFDLVEKTFNSNIQNFASRIVKCKMSSDFFFKNNKNLRFDLIYIDGSHYYKQVYRDAINSLKILKPGGIIIFDDFLFRFYKKVHFNPISAIYKFLRKNKNKVKIKSIYRQIAVSKINE